MSLSYSLKPPNLRVKSPWEFSRLNWKFNSVSEDHSRLIAAQGGGSIFYFVVLPFSTFSLHFDPVAMATGLSEPWLSRSLDIFWPFVGTR